LDARDDRASLRFGKAIAKGDELLQLGGFVHRDLRCRRLALHLRKRFEREGREASVSRPARLAAHRVPEAIGRNVHDEFVVAVIPILVDFEHREVRHRLRLRTHELLSDLAETRSLDELLLRLARERRGDERDDGFDSLVHHGLIEAFDLDRRVCGLFFQHRHDLHGEIFDLAFLYDTALMCGPDLCGHHGPLSVGCEFRVLFGGHFTLTPGTRPERDDLRT
jgi:hypothetical protein